MLGLTVERLLADMTAQEYLEWLAFLSAENERAAHADKKQREGIR